MACIQQALRRVDAATVRIAVTGAGGWLGRELTDLLLETWGEEYAEQLLLLGSRDRTVELASGREVHVHALAETDVAVFEPTHVIHLAFMTRDRIGKIPLTDYVATNQNLTTTALQLLELESVRGLLFTSSGAALSPGSGTDFDWYGELKRADEEAFPAVARDTGKTCVTCRVWSVSGANMQKINAFALGSLISQAQSGGPLTVRAPHPVYRRYVDAGEFLALGLLALVHGDSVVVDSAGERVEVGELAARVAAVLAPNAFVIRPEVELSHVDEFTADPVSMERLAARYQVKMATLDEQILRTASGIGHTGSR